MAFTEENKQDAYFVFTSMFQAAPGKVFAAEIVAAYNAGMTTAQIVAEYATKAPFLKLYPATQSNADFAAAFVKNVLGNTVTDAVKAKAAKEIETALNGGMPKAEVIFNSLSNLSKKTVADAEYGKAAQMLENKIAVAKELTEGAKALDTTDVDLLQSPLKGVTEDVATVQAAINGSSALSTKLQNLTAAKKALTDFVTANKLGDSIKDVAAAEAKIKSDAETASKAIKVIAVPTASDELSTDAAVKAAQIQTALATQELAVKNATKYANDYAALLAQVKNSTGGTLLDAIKTKAAADQSKTTAENIAKAGGEAVEKAVAEFVAAGGTAALSAATATITTAAALAAIKVVNGGDDLIVHNTTKKTFEFATGVTAENQTKLAGVLKALNEQLAQVTTADAAVTAAGTADAALSDTHFPDLDVKAVFEKSTDVNLKALATFAAVTTGANSYATKVTAAEDAVKALNTLNQNIAKVNASETLLAQLKVIAENQKAVEKSFTDAGYKLPVELEGALFATSDSDIYLVTAKSADSSLFGFAGKDVLYVGANYTVGADVAKGDDSKLEVFFKANGASTDVYVEQKAFGSSSAATTKDIVKITLTGVTADKVNLSADGFITVA